MSLSLDARRARLLAIRDKIDAGGGGALHLYGGAQPGMGAAAAAPPLLIVALGAVSFELHATEASMALTASGHVAISGVPTWARFVDGSGLPVMDLPAGLPGSGAPVVVSDGEDPPSRQLWTGGLVNVSASIAEPEWA